jgi:hypothetical protein
MDGCGPFGLRARPDRLSELRSTVLADSPPRHLPLANRAVLRMQAAFTLCDWLARRLPPNQTSDPWSDFSQPPSDITNTHVAQQVATRQRLYAQCLRSLLEQRNVREEFTGFVARSLAIHEDDAIALLWQPPRAVLTEVVPTLLPSP